ncbi:transposase family protein [Nocardia salmonicida]|uniref:transposase family protein n=1 Tax=Nocardia salmonicida TaxID=53431 RepID=UPI0033DAE43A
MLFYRATLPLSSSTLHFVAAVIRRHRREIGSRWRALDPGQQAMLVLVYLRKGEPFTDLAAGFEVSTSTAWRYVEETTTLLAAQAPGLRSALRRAKAAGQSYLILDGTVIAIDRVAADRPFYSGKHRLHGMNVQVLTSPEGEIVWLSPALPGSVHDSKAAWIWQIVTVLVMGGWVVLADKGYQGVAGVLTPYKGRNKPASQKRANRAHARLRGRGERAFAQLKVWKILRKLRCCPDKTTRLVKAIGVLQDHECQAASAG